ncbi:MAG: DNA/RNA non-specific endonuclease [Flavobacteriales bacterium]|tara:strand:- start:37496 stop:38464 length:969 start_codon:yes stop_codon:yes gene_type:complete
MKLFFVLFLIPFVGICQDYLPKSNGELVNHSYYSLSYSEEDEQAQWVYYKLSPQMINGSFSRTDNFRSDSKVKTSSASKSDYYKSGYDRGHLAPAADMKISHAAMSESFYMSNMSPQNPSFNRGGWKKLESLVRSWVLSEGEMYVVTGGVFNNNLASIGSNEVSVPSHYYKIIYSEQSQKMVGLVMPNQKITSHLSFYVVSVDYIEDLTGIDFFHQLNDQVENSLESTKQLSSWDFSASSMPSKSSSSVSAGRCKGIAKSTSSRCGNSTKNENGYCYAHKNQSSDYVAPSKSSYKGRCNATTKSGSRCKRNAAIDRRYCWQH